MSKLSFEKSVCWMFLTFLILGMGGGTVFAQVPMSSSSNSKPLPSMLGGTRDFHPHFARFVTNAPGIIVWGREKQLMLCDIEKKSILNTSTVSSSIRAVAVHPKDNDNILVSTIGGLIYQFKVEGSTLVQTNVTRVKGTDGECVRYFLFNPENPVLVAGATEKKVFFSSDGGKTWDFRKYIALPDKNRMIILLSPCLSDKKKLLISTTGNGRYRLDWKGKTIESLPETEIPHGYKVQKGGREYFLVGKNPKVLSFRHMDINLVDVKVIPLQNKTLIFGAGIGRSPLKIEKIGPRVKFKFLNTAMNLTFSIDVEKKECKKIIVTTPSGLFISWNGGIKWEKVECGEKKN